MKLAAVLVIAVVIGMRKPIIAATRCSAAGLRAFTSKGKSCDGGGTPKNRVDPESDHAVGALRLARTDQRSRAAGFDGVAP